MTAEIAILNKSAVALAADSAVTVSRSAKTKIYNTDKLFMLSRYCPIGIMVHNEAEFLGIPWETLIKSFRKHLDKKPLDKVEMYADEFMKFLAASKLFTGDLQAQHFKMTLLHRYSELRRHARKKVNDEKAKGKTIDIKTALGELIQKRIEKWTEAENLPGLGPEFGKEVVSKYHDVVEETIQGVFKDCGLPKDDTDKLLEIASYFPFKADTIDGSYSGIVVAGFGEAEAWPSLYGFIIDGMILDKLKFYQVADTVITNKMEAAIIPFAQDEGALSFIEGVDPLYDYFVRSYVTELVKNYQSKLSSSDADTERVITDMADAFERYKWDKHISPFLEAVEALPKDEIATLAESLVYLTSMKRRYSFDYETVGGPIDVAVISKGDGFIWIKRKHYFKPELNPQFFSNRYGH